jgi:hypothetical protein
MIICTGSSSEFWICDFGFRIAEKSRPENNPVGISLRKQSKTSNPKSKTVWALLLSFAAFAMCAAVAEEQQTGKIFRIGYLDGSTVSGSGRTNNKMTRHQT